MGKQKQWIFIMSLAAMLILIMDGKCAILGARQGLDLCLTTVIPSLFPYLFLSSLLTFSLQETSVPVLGRLGRLLGIPQGAEGILVSAVLGGYPAGAQAVVQTHEAGMLDRKNAKRLLMFCSNAGPAFLFGMVSGQFPSVIWCLRIWLVQLTAAVMTAMVIPGDSCGRGKLPMHGFSAAQILEKSVRTMALICGWIILFRMGLVFLDQWILWLLPVDVRVAVYGLLELSNGCLSLGLVEDLSVRFLLANAMIAFGGLCVVLQTASVAGSLGLRSYLLGKLIQTVVCVLLSLLPMPAAVVSVLLTAVLSADRKKRCSILPVSIV